METGTGLAQAILQNIMAHNRFMAKAAEVQETLNDCDRAVDKLVAENERLTRALEITEAALTEAAMWYEQEVCKRKGVEAYCPVDHDPEDWEACQTYQRPCVPMQRTACWVAMFERIHGGGKRNE